MNHLMLLTIVCCPALLRLDLRCCYDYKGWVAGFIAFERAAHCAIGKDVITGEIVGVVDPVGNYFAV